MIRSIIKLNAFVLVMLFVLSIVLIYGSLPDVEILKTQNPKTTAFIEFRKKQARLNKKKIRIRQRWVGFRTIPKRLRQAVRISEDASFYKHEGVDFEELKEAIRRDIKDGRLSRGASTITQQLAKNLYLSEEKTFVRKIKEYLIARRLENALSKYRIYHLYLNVIEFGPGIFGIGAASSYYFKKHVSELALDEMVRLAAVIPRPLKVNPTRNRGWVKWKSNWILKKLKKYKYISEEEFEYTKLFLE